MKYHAGEWPANYLPTTFVIVIPVVKGAQCGPVRYCMLAAKPATLSVKRGAFSTDVARGT